MRRSPALLSAVLLAGGLLAPTPAHADDTVTVVSYYSGEDSPVLLDWRRCSAPELRGDPQSDAPRTFAAYTDDPSEALGERALQLRTDGTDSMLGFLATTATPTQVPSFTMRVRTESWTSGAAFAYYFPPGGTDYWLGYNRSVVVHNPGWHTVTGGAGLTWHPVDGATREVGPPLSQTADLDDFAAAHGGDYAEGQGGGAYVGFTLGCDGTRFLADNLRIGAPGSQSVYDFEGFDVDLAVTASPQVITAGRATTVRGLMTKSPYAETDLELEARAFGSTVFVPVGQATYRHGDDGAPATLSVRPTRATVYRWRMPEQASTAGAVSPPVTVQVRTVVSLWTPARAAKGRPFRATGRTTPAKPGTVVTLERKVGNRWVRVSSGRVARDGTYALTARSQWRTTWTLRVVGGAGTGNLAGTSPSRRVVIS